MNLFVEVQVLSSTLANLNYIVYNLSKEERKARGTKGREWALSDEAGFTGKNMGKKVITTLDKLFKTWKPREKYELINANEVKPKVVPHELVY